MVGATADALAFSWALALGFAIAVGAGVAVGGTVAVPPEVVIGEMPLVFVASDCAAPSTEAVAAGAICRSRAAPATTAPSSGELRADPGGGEEAAAAKDSASLSNDAGGEGRLPRSAGRGDSPERRGSSGRLWVAVTCGLECDHGGAKPAAPTTGKASASRRLASTPRRTVLVPVGVTGAR